MRKDIHCLNKRRHSKLNMENLEQNGRINRKNKHDQMKNCKGNGIRCE